MKFVICFFLLSIITLSLGDKPHYDLDNAPCLFEKFIKDYNKSYKNDADREVHYQAFFQSLKDVNELNAGSSDTVYDINEFSDYTEQEWSQMTGSLPDNEEQ